MRSLFPLLQDDNSAPKCLVMDDATPTVKYEKKKRPLHAPNHADEHKALQNWQAKMRERKRQQGYISSECNPFNTE